ncbi:MAG: transcription termination factor NusA [Stenotrophomonas maltophilia]
MKSDFLIALTQLAAERHLPKEQVLGAIEVALASAFKKDNSATGQNISVKLNPNTGDVSVFALKTVVDEVEDPDREITLLDAQEIRATAAVGEEVALPEALPHNASRIAAQTAKQVVLQRLREAERELLYEEFVQHKEDIISGVIEHTEYGRTMSLDLGRAHAVMPPEEQVPTERYKKGQRLKVYVLDVRSTPKGPAILVSRSHKDMLKRLFEIEVPEVYNGVVEIKAISREPGQRSKVAVNSTQEGIDPVGSCIGVRGNRIQSIVNELQGEKIDVVPWDEDPKVFIARAISPSEVIHVELNPPEQTAMVIVPDRQLSLAIGKEGQNARLAARLAGWRLDIKGLTEWEEIKERVRTAQAEKAEPEVAVEEAAGAVAVLTKPEEEPALEEMAVAAGPAPKEASVEPEAVLEQVTAKPVIDEDAVLEALIKEEEEASKDAAAVEEAPVGLSVEELASFTMDEVEEGYDDEEELEPDEGSDGLLTEIPVLTPDAGKIRFAEDLVGEFRGPGRTGRRAARQGGARGPARGNSNRGGGAR